MRERTDHAPPAAARRGRPRPALVVASLLLALAGAAAKRTPSGAVTGPGEVEAARLVYLLEYIGADYPYAVRDGAILDDFEYAEMLDFSRVLYESAVALTARGAAPGVEDDLGDLLDMVLARAPAERVSAHVRGLVRRLIRETGIDAAPRWRPDLKRGARSFAANCAPCHGERGAGDGRAAPGMEPPPTSFRERRMDRVSPHQVYGATLFGVEGTAMPSFDVSLPRRRVWDLAFFVMTLREGFAPAAAEPAGFAPGLDELALSSNDELLRRADAADVDYRRLHPPRP